MQRFFGFRTFGRVVHSRCLASKMTSWIVPAAFWLPLICQIGLGMIVRLTLLILDSSAWPVRVLVAKRLSQWIWFEPSIASSWGGSLIDDSIDAAAATLNGNPNAALLFLSPAHHSNINVESMVKKRRQLEDKLIAHFACIVSWSAFCFSQRPTIFLQCLPLHFSRAFDVTETSLIFADAAHGADKRRRSQFCHWASMHCNMLFPWVIASLSHRFFQTPDHLAHL